MAQQHIDVNAHRAAFREHRANPTYDLQETVERESWWKRYFKWETLTVAGRTIEKGWVVPQGLGIALIVFVLGFAGTLHWRVTDAVDKISTKQTADTQEIRVLLNRLDERSLQDDKYRREQKQDIQQQLEGIKSHQAAIESVMNRQFAELKRK
jgi:hypothetical protein